MIVRLTSGVWSIAWLGRAVARASLGPAHVETTMIYTHVVKELRAPAQSPLDMLGSGSV